MTAKQLKELYRKQSAALALTARMIADMDPTGKFSSLDVHHYPGSAPVVIQTFATCPGTDLSGSASQGETKTMDATNTKAQETAGQAVSPTAARRGARTRSFLASLVRRVLNRLRPREFYALLGLRDDQCDRLLSKATTVLQPAPGVRTGLIKGENALEVLREFAPVIAERISKGKLLVPEAVWFSMRFAHDSLPFGGRVAVEFGTARHAHEILLA